MNDQKWGIVTSLSPCLVTTLPALGGAFFIFGHYSNFSLFTFGYTIVLLGSLWLMTILLFVLSFFRLALKIPTNKNELWRRLNLSFLWMITSRRDKIATRYFMFFKIVRNELNWIENDFCMSYKFSQKVCFSGTRSERKKV